MEAKHLRLCDTTPVRALPGVCRRTLVWGERAMLLHNTFEAGSTMAVHSHPHEQITYIVEGALDVSIGEQVYSLTAGDSLLIPSNAPHGVVAHERAVAIDVFSPPRDDLK